MATYNHAFTIAFSIGGSKDKTGGNITEKEFTIALLKRIAVLNEDNEMIEAIGMPFDTYLEA